MKLKTNKKLNKYQGKILQIKIIMTNKNYKSK